MSEYDPQFGPEECEFLNELDGMMRRGLQARRIKHVLRLWFSGVGLIVPQAAEHMVLPLTEEPDQDN